MRPPGDHAPLKWARAHFNGAWGKKANWKQAHRIHLLSLYLY